MFPQRAVHDAEHIFLIESYRRCEPAFQFGTSVLVQKMLIQVVMTNGKDFCFAVISKQSPNSMFFVKSEFLILQILH